MTGRTLFTAAAARESKADQARAIGQSLAYLASPYSKYPHGLEWAFVDVAKLASELLHCGIKVYSPIVHGHALAVHGGLDPLDHKIWLPLNDAMLAVCDILIVAQMDGWKESVGIAREIATFEKNKRRIFDLDPGTFVMRARESV